MSQPGKNSHKLDDLDDLEDIDVSKIMSSKRIRTKTARFDVKHDVPGNRGEAHYASGDGNLGLVCRYCKIHDNSRSDYDDWKQPRSYDEETDYDRSFIDDEDDSDEEEESDMEEESDEEVILVDESDEEVILE